MSTAACIIVVSGPSAGLFAPIGEGGKPVVVGRDHGVDLQVTDTNCSRRHFAIRYDDTTERFTIADLGSSNGTHLNGRPVLSTDTPTTGLGTTVTEDDEITAGQSAFMLSMTVPADRESALAMARKITERYRSTIVSKPQPRR